jgi:PAN domain
MKSQHVTVMSSFLLTLVANMLMTPGTSVRAAGVDLGCEGVKIEVNVDTLSLEQYQAVVKEHRCKCLKVQSECSPSPPRRSTEDQNQESPSLPTPSTEDQNQKKINRKKFMVYDGRDIDGSDFHVSRNILQAQCIELCKNDSKCIAFSWDRWNSYCFLKHVAPSAVRIDPQSMSAVAVGEVEASDSSDPIVMERFYNAEFRDKPFRTLTDLSYMDCERSCLNNQECEVVTYETAGRLCKFIRRPYQYYRLGSRTDRHTISECVRQELPVCSAVKRQRAP